MKERNAKFSKHVGHLEEGGLNGWCATCPPEERHAAIERTERKVGYRKTIDRLEFIRNVADRKDNAELHRVAAEDVRWAEAQDREREISEDRRRSPGDRHEVEAHPRESPSGRSSWVRRHMARNPSR